LQAKQFNSAMAASDPYSRVGVLEAYNFAKHKRCALLF